MSKNPIPTASGIYKIKSPSGNFYIGSAVNLRRRWHEHKIDLRANRHYNKPLANAAEKYGIECLLFEILEFCGKQDLIQREQHFINLLCPKYNIQKTAGSPLGMKYSEETKKKVRLAATNISDETRAKRSAAAKAQWANKESRNKIVSAIANSEKNSAALEKFILANKSRIPSAQARLNMSLAAKNRKQKEAA